MHEIKELVGIFIGSGNLVAIISNVLSF